MANDGRILIRATVIAIKDDQILYPSCKQCYSKLQREEYEKEWVCFKCSTVYEESKLEWRYRLGITVAEKASLTDIALFGKTLEPYFGTSAERFHRFLEKIDEDNLLEENMLLNALEETFVGQSFIFGIKSNARLKELQRYHGPMSPVGASTVLKLRLGDYCTQSSLNSDLVAVQILSSANVSFTGNTVLYNLQTLTDFNWETKPLCSVGDTGCKAIQECSYLPYTTFDQSDSYSCLKDWTNSAIELSYEKSVESSFQATCNETGHVSDLLEGNLELSLETTKQQKIKNKNNQVSRLELSNKLSLDVDPCLKTMEENGVGRNAVINAKQQNYNSGNHIPELNNQKQGLSKNNSETNSPKDSSHGQDWNTCLKPAKSRNFIQPTICDNPSQNISDIQCGSKLKDNFLPHSTTIESGNTNIKRSSNKFKLTSVSDIHDESSLEVLRNYDHEIKAHYDPSYLSYSDWDNSFNFSGLFSDIAPDGKHSPNTQKVAGHVTVIDIPESENLDKFLSETSFFSVACPESLQLRTSLKLPSEFKPKNFGKDHVKLSDKATMQQSFKKSKRSPDPLNGVSRNPKYSEKVPENVCEMPESEDLSKFLDNDSFDAQIMTEDFMGFDTQQIDFPILDPKCDNSRNVQPFLDKINCDIIKSHNTKIDPHCDNSKSHDAEIDPHCDNPKRHDAEIDPHCDNPKSHNTMIDPHCDKLKSHDAEIDPHCDNHKSLDAMVKVLQCESPKAYQTEVNRTKCYGAFHAVLNDPHQSNAGGSDCSQNINCDQSTYLSFEACLEEIEDCELTSLSFVSSQILLDKESKKIKQPVIIGCSAVNEKSSLDNSNGSNNPNINVSAECDSNHEDFGNLGDDSQGSMCLFSDEEEDQASFNLNPRDFRHGPQFSLDLNNVHNSNFETFDVGKDDSSSHDDLKIKDFNAETLEDSAADASTVLDLETMRNTSVHFNPDILTESLFGDSISYSQNDISELLLGMDLKDVEVERHSYQNVIQKEDNTAEWGTDVENEDFLALDLCKVTCGSDLSIPPSKSIGDLRGANRKSENQTNNNIINGKELPVTKKAILDLDFDSVDDSEILAMDCDQKQFSGSPISPSKFDMVPEIFMFEDEKRKDLHQNEETMNDLPSSPSIATRKGGTMSIVWDAAGRDLQETLNTPKPKILPTALISNGVHENDFQQNRTHKVNELNDSDILDVTEYGSMDLFDCSQSFAASQSGVKSHPQSLLIVDNSVLDTSEPFLNPALNLCLSKRVKFARRLSTVRHLNLVDIRLNMCKTSSPLSSALNLKSCLRKSVQEVTTELDESVFSQNVFSPSPVKSTRDIHPAFICRTESSNQLRQEPGINCYNSTPVNSNRSRENSVFSPDLFSPG